MVRKHCSPLFCQRPKLRERQRLPGAALSWAGLHHRTGELRQNSLVIFPPSKITRASRGVSPPHSSLQRAVISVHPITLLGCRYLPGLQLQRAPHPALSQLRTPLHPPRAVPGRADVPTSRARRPPHSHTTRATSPAPPAPVGQQPGTPQLCQQHLP